MNIAKLVRLIVLAVQLAGTVIGNALLILFVWRSRQLHRSASLNFIFNCGIADTMSAVINIPFAMDYSVIKTGSFTGSVATAAGIFALSFLVILTLSATLSILIDRILIVKFPVKYMTMVTSKRARRAIFVMWLSVLLVTILYTVIRFVKEPMLPDDNSFKYIMRWYHNQGESAVFVPFGIIIVFVILPSAFLYWQIRKRLNNVGNDASSEMSQGGDRKITASCRTVLYSMILYLVCYLPLMTIDILDWFNIELFTEFENNKGFYLMVFVQMKSLINPYMFILRSSKIRETASRDLTALARRNNIIPPRNRVQDRPQDNTKMTGPCEAIEMQNLQRD